MSTDRETTRIVRSWLEEGVTSLPDPVLDAVLDQLPTTPQRRAGWLARRFPLMNNIVRVGLAAAAVVVLAVVAINLLPGSGSGLGGTPSVEPTVEPTPTPLPSAAEPTSSADAFLPEGPILIWDPSLEQPTGEAPTITVTISSTGWHFREDYQYLRKGPEDEAPPRDAVVWPGSLPPGTGFYVYGDPCQWSSTRPETPATTVDEIVAAMASQASRNASEASDVMIGGYAGKTITLHVPEDANFADCDNEALGTYEIEGQVEDGPTIGQGGPGRIDQFWILDVEGSIVNINTWYWPDTPDEYVEEMQAIVESATFELP